MAVVMIMSVVLIAMLCVAAYTLAVYALPFAVAGAALGAYHTALIAGWVPAWWVPCGTGPSCSRQDLAILGGIQLPWLSLAAFLGVLSLLYVYLQRTRR